ncbi:MAG: TolC family protein [Acidobacteria bacterium]|nr:TolC family protein [Acidobacteriota bacterium]
MSIQLQLIKRAKEYLRRVSGPTRFDRLAFVVTSAMVLAPCAALARQSGTFSGSRFTGAQQPPSGQRTQPSSTPQQSPPAGTTTTTTPTTQQPAAPPPSTTQAPPSSPPPAPGQTPPQTSTPAATTAPGANNPAGAPTSTGGANGVPQSPGQNIGVSGGVAPAELPVEPPPIAPNFEAPSRPLPSAERVGVDMAEQTPLTLNEAISLALQHNNDIDGSRIDVQVAEYNLTAARGVYDPIFSTESFFESRVTPTSSTLGGAQNDNQNATLNPQFPTALTFTYTQPLWRGLRFDQNRRTIEIAKKNLSLTDSQFRQRAIEVISQVEQSYWDLAFALRNLQVQIDAVRQARVQVESNQRLVAKGVLAPIEIIAANTQVTTFEQNVYTAQEAVTRAENTLKTLILPDRSAALWSRPLTPVTPVNLEAPRVPLEQAVAAAINNRPELAQLQTGAEINQLDTRYFRDLTKPQIDLVGTYTALGLAGSLTQAGSGGGSTAGSNAALRTRVNELSVIAGLPPLETTTTGTGTVTPNLVGGYTQSLTNLLQQDYPTYRVGVRVSLPLRNRTAEANLGRSLAEGSRIRNQRAQAEQLIEADVRNATQSLRSAEARLASAASSRSSAEQQSESEQRQFRAGTTTVYLVLQRQTELLAARGRELQAQTDLNKAIADFQRATGNTLQSNNVSVRADTRELEMRPSPDSGALLSAANPASVTTGANPDDK